MKLSWIALYILGVFIVVIGLIISVALHELGHMLPAKLFGASVPTFMIGFGKTLYSRVVGDTEYGIKAVLLGGYVQIAGIFYPGKENKVLGTLYGEQVTVARYRKLTPAEREHVDFNIEGEVRAKTLAEEIAGCRPFYALKRWQRLTVMFGGPAMNAILSFVFTLIAFMGIGVAMPTATVAKVLPCADSVLTSCAPELASPATIAGIKAGDTITSWDGVKVSDWKTLVTNINSSKDKQVTVGLLRHGQTINVQVRPVASAGERGHIGIISELRRESVSFSKVSAFWWDSTIATAKLVGRIPQSLWNATAALLGQETRDRAGVMSVVGVGRVAGAVATGDLGSDDVSAIADRAVMMLMLLASLNIALFVFNLIPLPPLDGGHIAAVLYEAVRVRITANKTPVDAARLMLLTYAVFGIFALMTVILIAADIIAPVQV